MSQEATFDVLGPGASNRRFTRVKLESGKVVSGLKQVRSIIFVTRD